MTFRRRADLQPHLPASSDLLDVHAAAQYVSDTCLSDTPVGRVGLEVEAHCYSLNEPTRRPSWEEITDTIATIPALPGGSTITVEPGGAVELSGLPMAGAVAAIASMRADRALVQSMFARRGLGLVLLGGDPLRRPKRVNPGARYSAMEEFFANSGSGVAGELMMTSTASIQVNLEAGPRALWPERVRLAHALGPTMVAISANSPMLAGRFCGYSSSRQWVWSELDDARCGPFPELLGQDPTGDWARYALWAPVMLVQCNNNQGAMPVIGRVPFAEWADRRVLLGGRSPTTADLRYHLSTLFPPVRPRRWLEIRYLDSMPDDMWPAVVFTVATLLDDPHAASIAAEATEPVATAWDRAARVGLADRRLYEAANTCVRTAACRAPAELQQSMQRLTWLVEQGRSPADDFSDQAVAYGSATAITKLAREEG